MCPEERLWYKRVNVPIRQMWQERSKDTQVYGSDVTTESPIWDIRIQSPVRYPLHYPSLSLGLMKTIIKDRFTYIIKAVR